MSPHPLLRGALAAWSVIVIGCGGESASTVAAPPAAPVAPAVEPPRVEPTTTPSPPAEAPPPVPAATFAPPTRTALAGGCTAGAPVVLDRPYALQGIAIAAGPEGGLVAFAEADDRVAIVPIDAAGTPRGPSLGLTLAGLRAVHALGRIDGRFVLMVTARCLSEARLCLFAQTLDAEGAALEAPAHVRVGWDEEIGGATWPSEATGRTAWLVGSFGSSHDGQGVHARPVRLVDDRPEIGERERFADTLPDGAELTGYRITASETEVATLFGSRGEDIEWDGEGEPAMISRRYLGRTGRGSHEAPGLGAVVEDLVLSGGELHVLVKRSDDSYAAGTLGRDGTLTGALTPIDVDALPPPFRERALAVLEPGAGHTELVVRDALGRRLGERVALPGSPAALAWTGEHFLAASVASGRATVVRIECVP
jgi:hypothetical protein